MPVKDERKTQPAPQRLVVKYLTHFDVVQVDQHSNVLREVRGLHGIAQAVSTAHTYNKHALAEGNDRALTHIISQQGAERYYIQ